MRTTLLVADENGQLGNRLFLFAHFASIAVKKNYRLYFPSFNSTSLYFECAATNNYEGYRIYSRFSRFRVIHNLLFRLLRLLTSVLFRIFPVSPLHRIIRLYHTNDTRIDEFDFYDMDKEQDFKNAKPFLFLQGWNFRSLESIVSEKKKILPFFRLRAPLQKKVDDFMEKPRNEFDLIIGVHVRRGDYKNYMNGRFYYEDALYERLMTETVKLFSGKRIAFLVNSNEEITITSIAGATILRGPGHFILDLYTFAACDYLIGPPSTYTQWASYYSDIPLKIIWDDSESITATSEFAVSVL